MGVLGTEGICRKVQKIQMQIVCKKWLCVAPWVAGVGNKETSKAWPQIRDPRELKAKRLLHGMGNSLRVASKGATGSKCFEDNL